MPRSCRRCGNTKGPRFETYDINVCEPCYDFLTHAPAAPGGGLCRTCCELTYLGYGHEPGCPANPRKDPPKDG